MSTHTPLRPRCRRVLSDLPPDQAPATSAALALFTDAEARAIWARAAQLQAEADDAGQRASGADVLHDAQTRTVALAVTAPAGMFFGRDVVTAAQEAGIDAAHVAVALAEHEAADSDSDMAPSDAQRARFVRDLGSDTGSVRAVAFLPGTREAVIEQLRDTFGRAPWQLAFDGAVGAAAGAGEVLRFGVPAWGKLFTETFADHASGIGVLTLHVLLEPRGTLEQPTYEVTVTADLRPGQHFFDGFMRASRVLMPVMFGVTGGILSGFDSGAASLLSGVAVFGAAMGAVAGVGMTAALRRIVRGEHGRARRELERGLQGMLRAVGAQALPTSALGIQQPAPRSLA